MGTADDNDPRNNNNNLDPDRSRTGRVRRSLEKGSPPVVIADDAIINIEQMLTLSTIGEEAIRNAFKSGELAGRNIGGPTGWVTTWRAYLDWAAGKSAKASTTGSSE